MSGFGSQPFGSTPYGIGQPADVDPNGGKILADEFTGESRGSRRLDPRSKDYLVDSFGRIRGMPNVQQLVLLAVSTELGSSSVRELGQELKKIERITNTFARRAASTMGAALQPLVDQGLIEVQSVTSTILANGRAAIRVTWKELTENAEPRIEEITG